MLLRRRARRAGQALVELALVLPLIVLALVGLIDMGRWLDASYRFSRAAADGARYGAVKDSTGDFYPNDAQIRAHIVGHLPDALKNATVLVNSTAQVGGQPAISVRVSGALVCFTPGFTSGIGLGAESWFPRR